MPEVLIWMALHLEMLLFLITILVAVVVAPVSGAKRIRVPFAGETMVFCRVVIELLAIVGLVAPRHVL